MAKPTIPAEQTKKLLVHFDVHQAEVSQEEQDRMAADLDVVNRAVEHFPQRDLRVLIEYGSRNNEYAVKTSLLLPGRTLVASDHNAGLHAAFEKCVKTLLDEIRAYKDALGQVPERQKQEKHTHQDLVPPTALDAEALDAAVEAGDYPAFRAALLPYEDDLRLRVGRWVERYPELQARMGRGMDVADLLEGVLLAAFEQHARRPTEVRYGDWLEGLIDPELREFVKHPDAELENVRMVRAEVEG